MAISIKDFHLDIRSVLKNYNSGFISPEGIDFAINKACVDILKDNIKEYESGQNLFGFEQSSMKVFSFVSGVLEQTLPTDVFKVSSLYIGEFEGDLLTDKNFNDRANSIIVPPSATRPIGTVYLDKIKILPTVANQKIKYWVNPSVVVHKYTSTNGIPVYNPTGSVDISFPISEYTKLFNRVLTYLAPASSDPSSGQLEQNILR